MANGSAAEVVTGTAVLLLAIGFMGYAVAHTGRGGGAGYDLKAKFDHIDGLSIGSDVRIGGVKIGSVTSASLDPHTYQAVVSLSVRHDIGVPADSSAVVTSDGLLGGKYLAIQPGGDSAMLPNGGTITVTQGSVSLEDLLGKFIFSMSDAKKPAAPPGTATPATAPPAQPVP